MADGKLYTGGGVSDEQREATRRLRPWDTPEFSGPMSGIAELDRLERIWRWVDRSWPQDVTGEQWTALMIDLSEIHGDFRIRAEAYGMIER